MVIDIRKDVPEFEMYVARRVSEHVAASKKQKKPKSGFQRSFNGGAALAGRKHSATGPNLAPLLNSLRGQCGHAAES